MTSDRSAPSPAAHTARSTNPRRPARSRAAVVRGLTLALAAGLGACSGGGEDASEPPPTTVSFLSSAANGLESGGAITVDVRIVTTLAQTAGETRVDVVDAGTGTATPGTDYATFAPQTVVFPAGTTSGTTQSVQVMATFDNLAEGADETVRLRLQNASGAPISGASQATVTILDDQTASLQFTSASTLTPDESTTTYPVTVELDLSAGAVLAFDVSATLEDDGTGNATSGVDYTAFTALPISFPAGSADGASVMTTVDVIDDADAEGPEFYALHLTGPGMAELTPGGPTRHIVTITDDEVAPTAALAATYGPTGSETSLAANGDTIDFGSQVDGAGPTAGTLLVVSNQGGSAMQLGAPLLSGTNENDFVVEVEAASLGGGSRSAAALPPPSETIDLGSPFVRQAGNPSGAPDPRPGLSVTVDEAALADLAFVDRARLHSFPLPGQGDVTLELTRVPLPLTTDAVLSVDGQAVPGGPAALLSDLSTWSGTALELPGSRVFVALSSAGPRGFIELDVEEGRTIHLTTESPATSQAPATCRLVHDADLVAFGGPSPASLCSGELVPPGTTRDLTLPPSTAGSPSGGGAPPTGEVVTVANCRLAIETDYQFFQKFGTSMGVTDYVTGLVAAISDQYFNDVQTTLSIAYLGIYTTAGDPWSTPDTPGDTAMMLDEFRTAWVGSGWPATADLAHFLSGANLGGGRAYLNVLCNQSFGFGVSGNLDGNINWGSWSGLASPFTWDFVVVAHELGHNFGASHTHEYCPPLDECATGTCVAMSTCSQGTLMSYCHGCGGMDNIDLNFHPNIANIMRERVDASCLGDALMQAGDYVRYRLRFDPRSGAGPKSATLTFDHDAPNATDPYPLTLTGTAQ